MIIAIPIIKTWNDKPFWTKLIK
ncbi:hypothetical protein CGLO_18045 [Colletotrichum gloeosporioides Cg-14]|uniref:Uncharacterized protein n=1 Tax=Colletotrichum gloeosporioides (strain Cg-14) TaxID=1237896 RepID=T0L4Z9_COLGC|nr:hypothetical protein CGLO_18045 [Colletotrichum gloeosporioides Cg-14]